MIRESNDPARPDDIRVAGWMVACHNDYWQHNVWHTFWLFTSQSSSRFVKGEGESDEDALNEIRKKIGLPIPSTHQSKNDMRT